MTHTVTSGETLSKIAQDNGLTLDELLNANPRFKANPNQLRVGDVLNIPGIQADAPPAPPQPAPLVDDSQLGVLSEKFETGGRGPGTVSGGQGDPGGVSYGSYQMASKIGVVARYIADPDFPFRAQFAGLQPGTPPFSAKWKEIAANQRDAFQASQHAFIKKTHFDPLVAKIKREDGYDVNDRSFALRNVIWSVAVQHGPGASIPHTAFGNAGVTPDDDDFDEQLIRAIYAERGRKNAAGNLVFFSKSSPAVQQGVANRFKQELKDALKMLQDEIGG